MPETLRIPKALLEVNDRTILDIELENLTSNGITDIIIVSGHKHEMLEHYVAEKYPHLNIWFVKNEEFAATNYIYSIWLTRELVDDDIVILHGDMVFDEGLLSMLLDFPSDNAALINNVVEPPEKDFKAVVDGENVIEKIGVDFFGENAFFCAPIYKFSMAAFSRWLQEIDVFVANGNVTCYAEDAYNNVADEIKLKAVYFDHGFCMEIDTPEDLDIAKEYYANKK